VEDEETKKKNRAGAREEVIFLFQFNARNKRFIGKN
jgi:hypothetical protein